MICTRPSAAAIMLIATLPLWISACRIARAPNKPGTPNGPSEGHRDTLYTFTTITTDPNDDGICYRFSWGDGDTSGWDDWVASGTATAGSHAYVRSGAYAVTAQAKDNHEMTSAWSSSHQIDIPNPGPPNSPSTPIGQRQGHPKLVYTYASRASDPDGDSVSIRFNWGDGDTSAWSEFAPSGSDISMDHSWQDTGAYFVRAQARDVYSAASPWSSGLPLGVGNEPPNTPETPSGPSEGTWDVSYTYHSSATDPENDSVAMRFDWGDGDTSAWSELAPSGWMLSAEHSWKDTGVCYVRAQARDEAGALSTWSESSCLRVSRLRCRHRDTSFLRGYTSPAIAANGTVYVGSCDYNLYAINADGSLKWGYRTGGCILSSSPAVASDGTVYVGSDDGYLYAVNVDGSLKWRYKTNGCIESSPAVAADGTVYVWSDGDCFYALNPDGICRWRFRPSGERPDVYSPSIGADGTIYVASFDPDNDIGYLCALNPDSTLKWRLEAAGHGWGVGPAIGADGTIYVGADDGFVYALNPDSTSKWRYRPGYPFRSTPTIAADGTVYIGSDDDYLYALSSDGTRKWRYKTGDNVRSSAAVAADGTVYVGSNDGYLYALDPNGNLEWRYETGDSMSSSPAIGSDGTVYVTSGYYIYAIRGSSALADAPWPKFHHDNKNTGRVGGGRRR